MLAPILTLAAVTLTIGLFAEPFVDYAMRAAGQLLDKSTYIDAVFSPQTAPGAVASETMPEAGP